MINNIQKLCAAIFMLLLMSCSIFGQTQILQPDSGSETIFVPCGANINYFDNSGADENYTANTNSTLILCASNAGCQISVEFEAFDIEASHFGNCFDNLSISGDINGKDGAYNGDIHDNSNGQDCFDGTGMFGAVDMPIFESVKGGCLKFIFSSDNSLSKSGWEAKVTSIGHEVAAGDSGCSLVSHLYELTIEPGECSTPFPIGEVFKSCSTIAPDEPRIIDGFEDEFYFSDYTYYSDYEEFIVAGEPKFYNSQLYQTDDFARLRVDPDNEANHAFGLFTTKMPYKGRLTFDYSITGIDGALFYGLGDPASNELRFIDQMFGEVEQEGTFALDLEEGELFTLAPGILFYEDEVTVHITNLQYVEYVELPAQYESVLVKVEYNGNEIALTEYDDLLPGEYIYYYELIDPEGQVIQELPAQFTVLLDEGISNGGSLSCNDDVTISADEACSVYIEPDIFLEGSYNCYDELLVDIWFNNSPANSTGNVNGTVVDFSDNLGRHTYTITNPENGNKCSGFITVQDNLPPSPDCPCSEISEEVDYLSGTISPTSPSFSRLSNDFILDNPDCETQNGSTYRYDAIPFQVTNDGSYKFSVDYPGDAIGAIYQGTFDPQNPCENLIGYDDDSGEGFYPEINIDLEKDIKYVYVVTTFSPYVENEYNHFISLYEDESDGLLLAIEQDCYLNCTEIDLIHDNTEYTSRLGLDPDFSTMDGCGVVESSFTDVLEKGECSSGKITRNWFFTDQSGNTSTCSQIFNFRRIGLNEIENPISPVILGCGADISPEAIGNSVGTEYGSPYVITRDLEGNEQLSAISENICSVYTSYTDQDLKACGDDCYGNRKVIRTWTIFDWCDQSQQTFVQVIKSVDDNGPTFSVLDTIVSTGPWSCTATFDLPGIWELHDDCDDNPQYTVSGPVGIDINHEYDLNGNLSKVTASGVSKGIHIFTYTAYDCCGNETSHDIFVTVEDRVAPVVTTKQNIVVSLTPGGEVDGNYEGQAKLEPRHIDNGSYDMCTDVYLEIRRPDEDPSCGNLGNNDHNNNITFNNDRHDSDHKNDIDDGQFVKFCCEDLMALNHDVNGDGELDRGYVKLILRVWDDGDMDGTFGSEGDNYNESWAFVKVEDKLPPVISCPPPATIYCDWPIDVSSDFGNGFIDAELADFSSTGKAHAQGVCSNVPVTFKDVSDITQCGSGTIKRIWRATSVTPTGPKVTSCEQLITILPRDTIFTVSQPMKNRDWNSCTFDESQIPDGHKPRVASGVCDVIGENIKIDTFLFEDGVCKKWKVTYNYVNWCTGTEKGPYEVYYFFDDKSKPVINDCNDKIYALDGNCEHTFTVSNSATDIGGCVDDGWLKWQLFVDTWSDGNINYYASSYKQFSSSWSPISRLSPDGSINPKWLALPSGNNWADVVYVKNIDATADEEVITVEIEKVTGPMSNHKVKWKVSDGCHNFATCGYEVMIVDRKAPTPYCLDISTALMQGSEKMVELWAADFDLGAFDNCTPQDWLAFTFFQSEPQLKDTIIQKGNRQYLVNRHIPHYFDENNTFIDFDSDGQTPWIDGIVYPKTKQSTTERYRDGIDQNGVGYQVWKPEERSSGAIFREEGVWSINVSVWDEKCNSDFCTVTLNITDNTDTIGSVIGGNITTEDGENVGDVHVELLAPIGEYPVSMNTNDDGNYIFSNNPLTVDYTITPQKLENMRNGVSTIDLVMMQRHLLTSKLLESPYQVIASDINGNGQVDPLDLLAMRKLILNISTDTGNSSWKFVDASQTFADPLNPWPIRESIKINSLSANDNNNDFIACKIGDVNGSANTRNNTPIVMETIDKKVNAGDRVIVDINSNQFVDVYGMQFTLEHNNLKLNTISSEKLDIDGDIIHRESKSLTHISVVAPHGVTSDANVMTIEFTALRDGLVSDMLQLSKRGLEPELYVTGDLIIRPIEIRFISEQEKFSTFVLLQNEPNPFTDQTTIGFYASKPGYADLSVTNTTGQVIYNVKLDATVGYNEITIDNNKIKESGVLLYTVKTEDYSSTKKMISIK